MLTEGVSDYSFEAALADFRLGLLGALRYPVHFHRALIGATGRRLELFETMCRRMFSAAVETDAVSVLP